MTSVLLSIMFILSTAVIVKADNDGDEPSAVSVASVEPNDYRIIKTITPEKTQQIKAKVDSITQTGAVISWQSVEDCNTYVVYRYDEQGKKAEMCAITNETHIELDGLAPDMEYKFVISSGFSDKALGNISFRTTELTPELSLSDVTSRSVEIKIDNLQPGSSVAVLRGNTENNLKTVATVNTSTYTDTGLSSATEYYYCVRVTLPNGTVKQTDVKSVKTLLSMGLPSVSGSTKTYAHYTAVTARSTAQYKLLNSDKCYTDSETGIRMIDDCYCVALGSYYGSEIGTKYRIGLSSGKSIKVILCDQKSNRHTDSNHQYAVKNQDIMEFYVQPSKIPSGVRGNYGNLEQFSGDIVSIEKYV